MTDVFKPNKRSEIMSHIKSKHTSPELVVGKLLKKTGFRFQWHIANLPGKPDFANKKEKIAVFVNGCFWHQHKNCKRQALPKSNLEYWLPKLENNIYREIPDEGMDFRRNIINFNCFQRNPLYWKFNKISHNFSFNCESSWA